VNTARFATISVPLPPREPGPPPSTAGISGRNTLLLPIYRPADAGQDEALPPVCGGRHRGGRALRRIEVLAGIGALAGKGALAGIGTLAGKGALAGIGALADARKLVTLGRDAACRVGRKAESGAGNPGPWSDVPHSLRAEAGGVPAHGASRLPRRRPRCPHEKCSARSAPPSVP
jgi:hypothetical protein